MKRIVLIAVAMLATASPSTAAPPPTVSRYMTTTDPGTLYGEGCNQANAIPHARVVLDFGQPWWNGSTYGTTIFGSNTFRSLDQIQNAAEAWLQGFWDCAPLGAYVRLAVGTNNFRGATGWGHGRAWADMVDRINAFISAPPSFASMETARGASDIELGWNTPGASRAWADGYASAYSTPSLYWNYGDAAGCPPYGACSNGWTQEDVYYVSWGVAPALPLPEIYCEACYAGDTRGGQSRQWQRLSLYGFTNHSGHAIQFLGAMTQWAAAGRCCTNTPAQGWSQLSGDLNSDTRTAQELESSTDVTYAN